MGDNQNKSWHPSVCPVCGGWLEDFMDLKLKYLGWKRCRSCKHCQQSELGKQTEIELNERLAQVEAEGKED